MNCPGCKRPNAEGLDFCDFCGTPLAAAPFGKRKTEMESAPAAPVKHATQMEAADPFDPFAPRAGAGAGAGAARPMSPPPPIGAAPPPPAPSKRKTEFDGGRDPFAPPVPGTPAGRAAHVQRADDRYAGRRVMGFLVTFDRAPDGAFFVLREGRNLLGRDAHDCDIVIADDDTVSSVHAVMICRGGRVIIDDEKSQNGTKLNGEEVMSKTDVTDGDVISLGLRTRLLCRLLDPAKLAAIWKPGP